jgi:hypothetical protein
MEVELDLKEKVTYKSFKSQKDLNESILNMIFESKTDKILFKGDPYDINYKMMKKFISLDNPLVLEGDIRGAFRKIIQLSNNDPYCMIYKKIN